MVSYLYRILMNNLIIRPFRFASFKKRLSNKCHKISELYHIHYYPFPTNCPSKLLIDYYLISNGHWKQTEHRLTRTRWRHKPTKCAADQCWSSVFVFFRFFPFRSSYDHPPKKPKGTRSVSYTVSSPIGLWPVLFVDFAAGKQIFIVVVTPRIRRERLFVLMAISGLTSPILINNWYALYWRLLLLTIYPLSISEDGHFRLGVDQVNTLKAFECVGDSHNNLMQIL